MLWEQLIVCAGRRWSEVEVEERNPFYKARTYASPSDLARRTWSMALRQNGRHADTSRTAAVSCVQACEVPCKVTLQQGFGGNEQGGKGLCWRLIGDHGEGWRSVASSIRRQLHSHLLAFCIDHTKEGSSHRHKHCQLDDWGLLGAERGRDLPHFNLLDTCWDQNCFPRRSCDSDQSSGAKEALISFAGCILVWGFAAGEAAESQQMLQRWSPLLLWALWRGDDAVHWCGTARQVWMRKLERDAAKSRATRVAF